MNIKYVIGLIFVMACSLPSLEEEHYDIRPCPDIKPIHLELHADFTYKSREKKSIVEAADLWSKASCLYKIDVKFDCHMDYTETLVHKNGCLSGDKQFSIDTSNYGCSFRPKILYVIGIKTLALPIQDRGVLAHSCQRASNIQESDLIVCQKEGMCY